MKNNKKRLLVMFVNITKFAPLFDDADLQESLKEKFDKTKVMVFKKDKIIINNKSIIVEDSCINIISDDSADSLMANYKKQSCLYKILFHSETMPNIPAKKYIEKCKIDYDFCKGWEKQNEEKKIGQRISTYYLVAQYIADRPEINFEDIWNSIEDRDMEAKCKEDILRQIKNMKKNCRSDAPDAHSILSVYSNRYQTLKQLYLDGRIDQKGFYREVRSLFYDNN